VRVTGRSIPAAGALLAAGALALPSGGAAKPLSGAAACGDSDIAVVDAPSERRARAAILCLLNLVRQRHERPAVTGNPVLAKVGQQLASDLADYNYLRHADHEGRGLTQRLADAGYGPRGTRTFKAGETLAYGFGDEATPSQLVQTLLTDRIHRTVVLGAAFQQVGIGIVAGTPDPDYSDGATMAIIFLRR
jgi:uncharacterized protein YkwD